MGDIKKTQQKTCEPIYSEVVVPLSKEYLELVEKSEALSAQKNRHTVKICMTNGAKLCSFQLS